jgi:hypothetical protein
VVLPSHANAGNSAQVWENCAWTRSRQEQEVYYANVRKQIDASRRVGTSPVVEGTHQGSVVRVHRFMARLEVRRARFHGVPADYASDRGGLSHIDAGGDVRHHHHPLDAPDRSHRLGLDLRPHRPQTADDRDPWLPGVQFRRRSVAALAMET